jgi:carboxyl-terminal processing protease
MHRLSFCFLFFLPVFSWAQSSQDQINRSLKKIETLLRTIDYYYVDTVNIEKITEKLMEDVLQDLDPHSVYIPKEEVQKANEPLSGNFEGIGVQFNILNDTILVVSPIIGGPSEKLGILAGDKMIKIEDQVVAGVGIKNSDVFSKLRGKKGTKVKVSILRRGIKELIDFTIVRDKIPIYSVDASYMIDSEVGYIKLSRFAQTTMSEIHEKMTDLKTQGMKKLVLDLTGNSGGYLHIANQLSDEFLSDHKMIVYTEGKKFPKNENFASSRGNFEKGNLVIMIDAGSASASEIVSGAVQDWDRGLIVGTRSFGKGLVQKPYDFQDSSMMRLTIQRYYTPSGRSIQKPYEDYEDDYSKRFERGELFHQDSIHFPDSLMYLTKNGRKVYGGGGIMPDVFVPYDTTMNSDYYRDLLRKGLFNSFTLNYLDKNRKDLLARYTNEKIFRDEFMITPEMLESFLVKADQEKIKRNEIEIERSKQLITTYLKAFIGRSLFSENTFFNISNSVNPVYKKAVELIKDDAKYKSYGLVE